MLAHYRCNNCGKEFVKRISNLDVIITCPSCKSEDTKIVRIIRW